MRKAPRSRSVGGLLDVTHLAPVRNWLSNQLEQRWGIDGKVYSHYILSVLLNGVDTFPTSSRGAPFENPDFDLEDNFESRRSSVVSYLQSLLDEDDEVDALVEELVARLSDSFAHKDADSVHVVSGFSYLVAPPGFSHYGNIPSVQEVEESFSDVSTEEECDGLSELKDALDSAACSSHDRESYFEAFPPLKDEFEASFAEGGRIALDKPTWGAKLNPVVNEFFRSYVPPSAVKKISENISKASEGATSDCEVAVNDNQDSGTIMQDTDFDLSFLDDKEDHSEMQGSTTQGFISLSEMETSCWDVRSSEKVLSPNLSKIWEDDVAGGSATPAEEPAMKSGISVVGSESTESLDDESVWLPANGDSRRADSSVKPKNFPPSRRGASQDDDARNWDLIGQEIDQLVSGLSCVVQLNWEDLLDDVIHRDSVADLNDDGGSHLEERKASKSSTDEEDFCFSTYDPRLFNLLNLYSLCENLGFRSRNMFNGLGDFYKKLDVYSDEYFNDDFSLTSEVAPETFPPLLLEMLLKNSPGSVTACTQLSTPFGSDFECGSLYDDSVSCHGSEVNHAQKANSLVMRHKDFYQPDLAMISAQKDTADASIQTEDTEGEEHIFSPVNSEREVESETGEDDVVDPSQFFLEPAASSSNHQPQTSTSSGAGSSKESISMGADCVPLSGRQSSENEVTGNDGLSDILPAIAAKVESDLLTSQRTHFRPISNTQVLCETDTPSLEHALLIDGIPVPAGKLAIPENKDSKFFPSWAVQKDLPSQFRPSALGDSVSTDKLAYQQLFEGPWANSGGIYSLLSPDMKEDFAYEECSSSWQDHFKEFIPLAHQSKEEVEPVEVEQQFSGDFDGEHSFNNNFGEYENLESPEEPATGAQGDLMDEPEELEFTFDHEMQQRTKIALGFIPMQNLANIDCKCVPSLPDEFSVDPLCPLHGGGAAIYMCSSGGASGGGSLGTDGSATSGGSDEWTLTPPSTISLRTTPNILPLDQSLISQKQKKRKKSKSEKDNKCAQKPCSFFMEGNCHRSDCKFAHDLSMIPCKFWAEGNCFKGPYCPFMHALPVETVPAAAAMLSSSAPSMPPPPPPPAATVATQSAQKCSPTESYSAVSKVTHLLQVSVPAAVAAVAKESVPNLRDKMEFPTLLGKCPPPPPSKPPTTRKKPYKREEPLPSASSSLLGQRGGLRAATAA